MTKTDIRYKQQIWKAGKANLEAAGDYRNISHLTTVDVDVVVVGNNVARKTCLYLNDFD